MQNINVHELFNPDALSLVMMGVMGFISTVVACYAWRNLEGDSGRRSFFIKLSVLVLGVSTMACADHVLLLLLAWGLSNAMLVQLMVHKSAWGAARASGTLAARNFIIGFACVATAFSILFSAFLKPTVSGILASAEGEAPSLALVLLMVGALTQSAIWPFHRWLISSANAPTPVSALMHAGLVNGGGFLLARFAPLFAGAPLMLDAMFAIGVITLLVGTLWKLMQPDIKRMLACSTMGQMGFMLVQCGLGLFPAAIAHLCSHGLFKAWLFLSSGGAAREKRLDLTYPPSLQAVTMALICGMAGSAAFAWVAEKSPMDASLVLIVVAALAGSQFALPMLRELPAVRFIPALLATAMMGAFYGANIYVVEWLLASMSLNFVQPLSLIHWVAVLFFTLSWLAMLFGQSLPKFQGMRRLYMVALNASQPHPATVTVHRNRYKY